MNVCLFSIRLAIYFLSNTLNLLGFSLCLSLQRSKVFPVRCNNNKTLTEMIMQIYNKYMCERLSGVVFRSFFCWLECKRSIRRSKREKFSWQKSELRLNYDLRIGCYFTFYFVLQAFCRLFSLFLILFVFQSPSVCNICTFIMKIS